jgi:hypothetical protein
MKNTNKIQEYAIKYLYEVIKMEPKTIAKELGILIKTVQKILNITQNQNSPIKTVTSSTENTSLLANKTMSNRSGVSIMTEAASSKSDEIRKQLGSTISRTAKNAIYRPRD